MKICMPVSSPDGLSSSVESILAQTQYLHIHDLETETFEEIDLSALPPGSTPSAEFEAVICTSIHRQVFAALRQQGKQVYLTEALTVGQALEEFKRGEMYLIADEAAKGCGGGCHGHTPHDHGHSDGGCQCGSESGESHCHSEGGGCGGHGEEGHACGCSSRHHSARPVRKARGDTLRFAVTSQNRKTITEHAGKCRKFWVYETRAGSGELNIINQAWSVWNHFSCKTCI